jgi:hypothetical protein
VVHTTASTVFVNTTCGTLAGGADVRATVSDITTSFAIVTKLEVR